MVNEAAKTFRLILDSNARGENKRLDKEEIKMICYPSWNNAKMKTEWSRNTICRRLLRYYPPAPSSMEHISWI